MVLAELRRRQPADAVMRYLGVVIGQPLLRLFAYFGEIAEDVHIQNPTSEAAIETFDATVLHRPSWLNETQRRSFAPPISPMTERGIADHCPTNGIRIAVSFAQSAKAF